MRSIWVVMALLISSSLTASSNIAYQIDSSHSPRSQQAPTSEDNLEEVAEQALHNGFIENIGQLGQTDVKYYGMIIGGYIGFSNGYIQLRLNTVPSPVKIVFLGARAAEPYGQTRLPSQTNFILGDKGTFSEVSEYVSVVYNDLWPNITLHYQSTSDGPKYEFEVNPGGNVEDIRLQYVGQDRLEIESETLSIQLDGQCILDDGLCAFQGDEEIPVSFVSHNPDIIGFSLGEYDRERLLLIDPLVYSTFLGGGDSDICRSVAVDSFGNAYVAGWTASIDFPKKRPFDNSLDGVTDCFVVKIAPNGSTVLFSTYIGGSDADSADSIAVDSIGNIYVAGQTSSPDFPLVNPYSNSCRGENDLFVLKMKPDGSSLIYSTYIGGSLNDMDASLVVDEFGYAHVFATTESPDFPSVNAFSSNYSGNIDGVLFKLNFTGEDLLYSTYLGGEELEHQGEITLDSEGRVYVVGLTGSPDFPTVNPLDDTLNDWDGYLSVFDLNASLNTTETLLYSTFIGGTYLDHVVSTAVADSGIVYIAGRTFSPDLPVTPSFDPSYNDNGDCFILLLNITDNSIPYCTYIGGADDDETPEGIAVDQAGTIFLVGSTRSSDFPRAGVGISPKYGNLADVFVLRLNASENRLFYSTLVGGTQNDWPESMALGDSGSVYVTGEATAGDFPTVNGAYLRSKGGDYEGFLFKLPNLDDSDEDGISDLDEDLLGTDKYDPDSDDDLLLDGFEVEIGTNPLSQDSDSDSLDDYQEVVVYGTNPLSPDTENDEMPDGWEVQYGLNPLVNDSMDDFDQDGLVNLGEYLAETDPTNPDSDSDTMPDGWELDNGLNPLDDSDAEQDADNDDLRNSEECDLGTNPNSRDSDLDNIPDGWEVFNGFDPLSNVVPISEMLLYNIVLIFGAIGLACIAGLSYIGYGRYLRAIEEREKVKLQRETQEAMDDLVAREEQGSG